MGAGNTLSGTWCLRFYASIKNCSLCQNLLGRCMLFTSIASLKSGAMSFGLYPARPHPISVTRKVLLGVFFAEKMNSSTCGLISDMVRVLFMLASFVGIPYVLP